MVSQHGPFSLHTMLEGPWLHKMAFPTHMVRPLDESQGSSPLQGHGSWLMCEVALRSNSKVQLSANCFKLIPYTFWTMDPHLRATSHTRLSAYDLYTSSTLIGGKSRAGPTSLHTTLWGINGVCECKMDAKATWNPTWHQMDHVFTVTWTIFKKPSLGGRPITKPGDYGTPNTHNCWFILFDHMWGPAEIKSHWNSIWLRAQSHMTSHYTWGSMTTLHDFGGVLGQHLDTFFWALVLCTEFVLVNENRENWEELTVSFKWTSWVWEITWLKFETSW